MKVLISKIDPKFSVEEVGFDSLLDWEAATQDAGADSLSVAVVYATSAAEYQALINDLGIDLEEIIQNYLLIHPSGKILVYKVGDEFMQCSYGKGFFERFAEKGSGYLGSVSAFVADKFSQYQSTVFLCHASQDKEIIKPLVIALDEAGINYWVDSVAIKLGDSITEKVNEGLRQADYFLVVLSKWFIGKPWPEKELNAILNMNIIDVPERIIPVFVGSPEDRQEILRNYPLLSDVFYFSWNNNPQEFISLFKERLSRDVHRP